MIKLLDRLFRHRTFNGHCSETLGPLFKRWYVWETRWFSIYVHLLHRPDARDLHDHPWWFWTFLLSSGYWEWTSCPGFLVNNLSDSGMYRFWRRRFSLLFRPALYRHRLEVTRPTWTLVVSGSDIRGWGFWTKDGFVPFKSYPYDKECG